MDIDALILHYQRTGDLTARNTAIMQTYTTVVGIARTLNVHTQDLAQEGMLAVIEAADTYSRIVAPFEHYASNCAKERMWNYLKRERGTYEQVGESSHNRVTAICSMG